MTSLDEFEAMKQSALNAVQNEDFEGSDEKEGERETDQEEEQGVELSY